MYKIILFIGIISAPILSSAQGQKDFTFYNTETYQLYLDASWKSLIDVAKESIEAGHDFYYLRVRMGIAFYEQQKYIPAIRQFEKALKFTPGGQEARNYLYYCYLFLGREKEAKRYYSVDEKGAKFLSGATLEPGIKFSDNRANTRNTRFTFIGLKHDFGKSISLFHGYQRLVADFAIPPDNSSTGQGGRFATNETIYSVGQNEYYAEMTALAGKGFYVIPAVHFQGIKTDTYQGNNRVFSLQLAKWIDRFKIYGGASLSEINELKQYQYEGGLVFYPLGNLNLFIQTQLTNHTEEDIHHMVSFNKIGFKLFTKTWLNMFYASGDMRNFNALNGYLVYNQLDTLKSKMGITLSHSLGKHFLYLNTTRENKEEFSTGTPFAHQNLVLGINFKF